MTIRGPRDFYAGLMFAAIGVALVWGSTRYEVGTAAAMGPGYFPLVLGGLLILVGIVVGLRGIAVREEGGGMGPWAWRPLFFVIAANVAIGIFLAGLPS